MIGSFVSYVAGVGRGVGAGVVGGTYMGNGLNPPVAAQNGRLLRCTSVLPKLTELRDATAAALPNTAIVVDVARSRAARRIVAECRSTTTETACGKRYNNSGRCSWFTFGTATTAFVLVVKPMNGLRHHRVAPEAVERAGQVVAQVGLHHHKVVERALALRAVQRHRVGFAHRRLDGDVLRKRLAGLDRLVLDVAQIGQIKRDFRIPLQPNSGDDERRHARVP